MRLNAILILCALLASSATAQQTPSQPETDALAQMPDGVYWKNGNSFVQIDQLLSSGAGMKHMGKMFVPGLTPQMVWTYRGPTAPLRLTDMRPVFYVKQPGSMGDIAGHSYRDAIVVRLDKKKDHRELQTTNGGNMFTFKAGIGKDKLPDIESTKLSDAIFKIAVKENLQAGEYLISFGMANSGYDFGIDEQRKGK